MHYNEYQNSAPKKEVDNTPQYDVDDILDKISAKGYTSLSIDEKDYLASLKK